MSNINNGLVKTSKNCMESTSKTEPWKRISTESVHNNSKTAAARPVAMPSRKRVQPQNKSKFYY